jgi:hypothetical protein
MPADTDTARWLRAFPSFGFLLSVAPDAAAAVCARFAARDLAAGVIGRATHGSAIDLCCGDARARFWDWQAQPYLGLHAGERKAVAHA